VQLSLIIGFGILAVVQAAVGVLIFRQQRAINRLSARLNTLVSGISLLTDTTETGLRDVATEIGRMASSTSAPRPRPRAATQRRVASAARRGRTVQEIAAAEQMSESEINLRLQLAAQ
jgi:hypothetical protein